MARSIQVHPLEMPTGQSCRYPLVHGARSYFPPTGPQRVADVFELGEVAEDGDPDPEEGVGEGTEGHLAAPHVELWISEAGPVFSAPRCGCEDICTSAHFVVCA